MSEETKRYRVTHIRKGKTYVAEDLTLTEAWKVYQERTLDPDCTNVSLQTQTLQPDRCETIKRSDPRHPFYILDPEVAKVFEAPTI